MKLNKISTTKRFLQIGVELVSIAVLTSSIAVSAPISVTLKSDTFSGSGPIPGSSLTMTSPSSPATKIVLPGPASDVFDRMVNYQSGDPLSHSVAIRKDQATAFGFDWDAFERGLLGYGTLQLRFGPGTNSAATGANAYVDIYKAIVRNLPSPPTSPIVRFADFEMEEIRINVDYYYWHPIWTELRVAKVSFEIDGSGNVVPEPTSFAMFVLAGLAMPHFLRRRWRRAAAS